MSTPLAIGAVTAVLRGLLAERWASVADTLGGSVPDISVLPPDLVIPPDTVDPNDTLNLFMYQVSPNLGWRNMEHPVRNSQGDRVQYPPLALNLHYLLSAHSQAPYQAEILLGYSMQVLHEAGVLPRELILERLNAVVGEAEGAILANATLAEQVEMLKITPEPMSTEEVSKLWAAFQTNYRPTVAYQVSVVLIESDRLTGSALPVREPRLFALPFQRPIIQSVEPQVVAPGAALTIRGNNLRADDVRIRFGTADPISPLASDITNGQIQITPPGTLTAGIKAVQVIHYVDFDPAPDTADWREGFESNTAPFILRPDIVTPPPLTVEQGAMLSLSVNPPVEQRQKATLLLGDQAIAAAPRPLSSPPTNTLEFPVAEDFPVGEYIVRLRVDGAESALQPETGPYTGPTLEVTASVTP